MKVQADGDFQKFVRDTAQLKEELVVALAKLMENEVGSNLRFCTLCSRWLTGDIFASNV